MRFTSGCPCAIRITETRNYLILQFHCDHGPECHARPMMSGSNSRPAQRAFQTYLNASGATGNEDPGMSRISFCITFIWLLCPYRLLSLARRWEHPCSSLASDITLNIMNAPVIGSPYMDKLRRQAKEKCLDRCTLLSYSSYDSDDNSYCSDQRKKTSAV